MHTNHNVLLKFYDAFSKGNATSMASCYHTKAIFSDPAFGKLNHEEVIAMWEMLLKQSKGNLTITFSDIKSNEKTGTVNWIATYKFNKTNRIVVNEIQANFEFKDSQIIKHTDSFNLWKWSGMALGCKGYMLGWTPFFQQKIRDKARKSLANYLKKE